MGVPVDPPQPAAVVPEPAPVVTPPAAPWAADAAAYFGDNADAIAGFDRYMREKQQPYITQLEESTKDARELWTDLNNDPATTARDLIASVYANDPDIVAAYDAIFVAEPATSAEPATPPPADEIPEWAKPLVESHQEKVDREAKEAAAAEYATAKTELQKAHADLTDDDLGLIDPFVYGAGGDMEQAYAAYKAWQVKAGVAQTPAPEVPATPPVLGSDGPSATPPLATQYTSYDQIGDAFKAYQQRVAASATPPPVVG